MLYFFVIIMVAKERPSPLDVPRYSLLIAEQLARDDVLQFGEFKFASGLRSPVKVVCDAIGANQECLDYASHCLSAFIRRHYLDVDTFVGVISGGAPFADRLALFHGKNYAARLGFSRIDGKRSFLKGEITPGSKVLVIEDVITVGTNSIPCSLDVRAEGGNVVGVLSLFNYGFPQADERFREHNLQFWSLVDFDLLLKVARQKGRIDEQMEERLRHWHDVETPAFFASQ